MNEIRWRKSTYSSSSNGGNCFEAASVGPVVAVRDSTDWDGPRLTFGRRAWAAFAAQLKTQASRRREPQALPQSSAQTGCRRRPLPSLCDVMTPGRAMMSRNIESYFRSDVVTKKKSINVPGVAADSAGIWVSPPG